MAFRFVHCADVHLDSPLRSLALRDPALAELVGVATRTAFTRTVDLCLAERVDALLVAGDLYDGDQTSMRTALFLGAELKRLDAAGIATFVIRGNHDHLARITRELALPPSVKVFGARAEAVRAAVGGVAVAVHGISFAQAHAPESLVPRFLPPVEGAVNVGMLHTSLGGSPGHDAYAPCTPAELRATGFRYWALGHVHARSVSTEGGCTVAMPGMPQGRDVNEAGEKSVLLVTIADDGTIAVEPRRTGVARFERVAVDLGGVSDWRGAVERIGAALAAARGDAACDHLVARLTLSGATPAAWRLRRDADLLRAEADALAGALGATTVEKLEVAAAPHAAEGGGVGPLAELRRMMAEDAAAGSATREAVAAALDELRRGLPPECRDVLGRDAEATAALVAGLAAAGREDVLARLGGEPGHEGPDATRGPDRPEEADPCA